MYCPNCRTEYRKGYTRCADCDVELVAALAREEPEDLTPVLRTSNQPLLSAFQAALSAAEIPHFVRGAEASSLMPINAVVVVPAKHVEAAEELLRSAEGDVESDDEETDDDDTGDDDTGDDGSGASGRN